MNKGCGAGTGSAAGGGARCAVGDQNLPYALELRFMDRITPVPRFVPLTEAERAGLFSASGQGSSYPERGSTSTASQLSAAPSARAEL